MIFDAGNLCPCGSGQSYAMCCSPFIEGEPAPTPETLMRSRYTAYSLGEVAYLRATWAAENRPSQLDLPIGVRWVGLKVISSRDKEADEGEVAFQATFREQGEWHQLREQSRFVRREGRWYYLDGVTDWLRLPVGRNDPCPCGSGAKAKKCCGG
jgi:SEC-C motif-containing protein